MTTKKHVLIVLDRTGDTTTEFAPPEVKTREAKKSREAAEKVFNQIMAEHKSVVVTKGEREGEILRKFDPTVEEAVAVPQIVGG